MKLNVKILAAALFAIMVAPAALAAGTGPFTGSVRQGETDRHRYDNNQGGNPCPQVQVFYTVTLEYTPTTDTLTLEANGYTAVGSGGTAVVSFEAPYCTSFTIKVTGTQVADSASYTVTVSRGGGATA